MSVIIEKQEPSPFWKVLVTQAIRLIVKLCLSFLLISALQLMTEYTVNKYLRGASYWLEYFSVVPALSHFNGSDDIFFRSNSITRNTPLRVVYSDNLHCSRMNSDVTTMFTALPGSTVVQHPKFVGFDNMPDEFWEHPNAIQRSGYWDWSGATPNYPARCYLAANIEIQPSMGVSKTVVIHSPWFTLGEQ